MGLTLLITDDPARSKGLAQELCDGHRCEVHDLFADDTPAVSATALMADLLDLGSEAVDRLRRLLARIRGGAPVILLLPAHTPRTRMLGVVLDATHMMCAPFDVSRLRALIGAPHPAAAHAAPDDADPLPASAVRMAAEVREFYASVFVPDQPITPIVIDNGTGLIARAVQQSGIRNWIRAVQRFDEATHRHCLLVTGLATAFAAKLGFADLDSYRLTKAALLHDVGKTRIPPAILNKPGQLTDEERAVMRTHAALGYDLLVDSGFSPEMLQVVRSHHEMLDGSGYPDGLRASEIPDLVRLITTCDIYGALIERRPYRAPMASEAAYAILEGMGGHLDPAIVAAFRPVAVFAPRPVVSH